MTGTILTVPGAGGDGIGFNSASDGNFFQGILVAKA